MSHEPIPSSEVRSGAGPMWTFLAWLFGILGGIAAFLGAFILLGDEGQYVGIGGDLSWRVGDISSAWAYGLLIGGGVFLLIALAMAIAGRRTPGVRGERSEFSNLMWHTGIFVVVNAFIWLQDIALGDGIGYAYWVTIPWGIGLAIHGLTYYLTRGSREMAPEVESTPHREPIEEEARPLQPH